MCVLRDWGEAGPAAAGRTPPPSLSLSLSLSRSRSRSLPLLPLSLDAVHNRTFRVLLCTDTAHPLLRARQTRGGGAHMYMYSVYIKQCLHKTIYGNIDLGGGEGDDGPACTYIPYIFMHIYYITYFVHLGREGDDGQADEPHLLADVARRLQPVLARGKYYYLFIYLFIYYYYYYYYYCYYYY